MKNLWLVFVLAVLISGLSACKGGLGSANLGGTAATSVPENAAAVVAINLKSLIDKADMDAVKKMDFYKDMVAETAREQGEAMAKILENPETSGVDLTKNAYFFVEVEGKDGEVKDGLVGFVFSIADKGDFENLVKGSDMDIEKGSGFQFGKNNQNMVAWDGSVGFVGSMMERSNDDVKIERQLAKLFSSNNSIVDNSAASKALGGGHDINYYFSTETVVNIFQDELMAIELFNFKVKDLKNNSFSGYTDFEKGKIVSNGNLNLSKGVKSDLKMVFGEGSKTDFSKYIARDGLMMLMNGKLNFKGINQLLKDKNATGLINNELNQVGLSADDIAAAIDGDIAIAMNSKKGDNDEPSGLFALSIGDKKKMDEILKKGEILGLIQKVSTDVYAIRGGFGMPSGKIIIKDNILFLSNDMKMLNELEKGALSKSERVDKSIYQAANGVLGMYMNYESMGKMMSGSPMDMNFGGVESMVYSLGWDESSSTTTMMDPSRNSLKVLIDGMNESYLETQKKREKYENEEEIDLDEMMEKLEKMEKIDM